MGMGAYMKGVAIYGHAWWRERGLSGARLHVHVDNGRARRAYEKAGFVATGVRITAVNGPELEMAKPL